MVRVRVRVRVRVSVRFGIPNQSEAQHRAGIIASRVRVRC